MHVSKNDIPVKVETPGAVARQLPDFGIASGAMGAEYFSMSEGTDLAPLLEGLEGDVCHSAHWGYLISGTVVVAYADGAEERCFGGEVVHWPAGHTVRVEQDAELILFSPQAEHTPVIEHIASKVAAE